MIVKALDEYFENEEDDEVFATDTRPVGSLKEEMQIISLEERTQVGSVE